MDTIEIPDVLKPVTEHIDHAYLIAWDGCHKIYLALDEIEAAWFATHYEQIVRADSDVMMATIVRWWNESCGLRFVSGVRNNPENPNDGFVRIVDQFAEYEEEDESSCDLCESPTTSSHRWAALAGHNGGYEMWVCADCVSAHGESKEDN